MSTSTTIQTATLNAADEALTVNVRSCDRVAFDLRGTFTATVTFEATIDEVTWQACTVNAVATRGTVATTATAAGLFVADVTEYTVIRARVSAYTSGDITAKARRSFTTK